MTDYDNTIECNVVSDKKILTDGRNFYKNGKKIPFFVKVSISKDPKNDGEYSETIHEIDDPILKHYGITNLSYKFEIDSNHLVEKGSDYSLKFNLRCTIDEKIVEPNEDIGAFEHPFVSKATLPTDDGHVLAWIVYFCCGILVDGEFIEIDDSWFDLDNKKWQIA